METIAGYIESVVFTEAENGFTVAKLKSREKELITIVGCLPLLQPGEQVVCHGDWKSHPKFGFQFVVEQYDVKQPCDIIGIQKYLESGLIHGIGPVYAKRIVDTFGTNTLTILDENPEKLLEIEGLGEKKVAKIKESWQEQRSIREVMIFLRSHGISPAYAQRIFKCYGDESIKIVQDNPYQLAKDVVGIGFKMADKVASTLGIEKSAAFRIEAGVEYSLWDLTSEGHTCYPKELLIPLTATLLEVEVEPVLKAIDSLEEKRQIVSFFIEEAVHISLSVMRKYELGISKEIKRLLSFPSSLRTILLDPAITWIEKKLSLQLADQQKVAVRSGTSDKLHIITGGPGTGKSTITNAILQITDKITDKILLAAPTGRAAKRLSQITRRKAFTIHALLEFDFTNGGFKKNRDNPLKCDLLIIDESSMIDTALMFHLLRAIPDATRLLFIGDIDQLPSVGPGSVLKDLIDSHQISITRLDEIFRQAKGSQIIVNAHKINKGEFPFLQTAPFSDFHFYAEEETEAIQQKILNLITTEIPKDKKFHPIEEIQLLSPMRKGPLGIDILNNFLQEKLNPSTQPFFRGGRRFHIKDKVMQIKNNYDKQVYNGDIGKIASIDLEEQKLFISFDGHEVEYDFTELDEITLAYAVSVHKYQGSECPCIVIPMHTSHFKLLYRNLLYTAVTRGKKFVALVGSKRAIAMAVKNDQSLKRYTGLKEALIETCKENLLKVHSEIVSK